MDFSFYVTQTINQVLSSFGITADIGLTDQQVRDAQKRYGLNIFSHQEVTWWHVLVRQLASPFFYLLAGAAVLSLGLGEILSGSMIILFTFITVGLGFYQEYHAENTIKMLKNLIKPKALVRRNSKELEVFTQDLVPGDIVIFEPGDIIPADVRFIQAQDLTVDESVLTGESVPIVKQAAQVDDSQDLLRSNNLGLCGTVVQTGKALGIVIATANSTMFGSIARVAVQTQRESIFAHEIKRFGTFMLFMIVTTLGFVLGLHFLMRGSTVHPIDLILFIVALAVTIIPEALPVVISFCLARGALQMARNNVVVRRLSAIEDLGGVEVLCTDKTGTLTENKLAVIDVFGEQDKVLTYAVLANSVISTADNAVHYSFDAAVVQAVKTKKIIIPEITRDQYLPYDQALWCVHALVPQNGAYVLVIRGAFEKIIDRCSNVTSGSKDSAAAWARDQGNQGRRILAVAVQHYTSSPSLQEMTLAHDCTLVGLIAFIDPIKETAVQAINKAKNLGITIKVITGDAAEVAGAVAQQIGLIKDAHQVITGAAFERMNDLEQAQAINDYAVFARIAPMQKLLIVKKLQETQNVGFLGEGVNDAPALKLAHVALVVENGADIAKDAADIILLKKSLHVIVDGVQEGRKVFLNTVKYLNVTLASNFSNFYTIALVSLIIDFLPMLPLQILLVNLLSDFPLIAISSDRVDEHDLRRPQNFKFRQIVTKATFFGVICSIFDLIFFSMFSKQSPALLQTTWFMFSILTELTFFYLVRSRKFFLTAQAPSPHIMVLTFFAFGATLMLPLTHFGQNIFKFMQPTLSDYGKIFSILVIFLVAIECVKYFYYRWIEHQNS